MIILLPSASSFCSTLALPLALPSTIVMTEAISEATLLFIALLTIVTKSPVLIFSNWFSAFVVFVTILLVPLFTSMLLSSSTAPSATAYVTVALYSPSCHVASSVIVSDKAFKAGLAILNAAGDVVFSTTVILSAATFFKTIWAVAIPSLLSLVKTIVI